MTAKKFLDAEEAADALVLQLRPLKEQLSKQVVATQTLTEAKDDLRAFVAQVEQLPPLIKGLFQGLDESTLVGIRKEIGSTLSAVLAESQAFDAKIAKASQASGLELSRHHDKFLEQISSVHKSMESSLSNLKTHTDRIVSTTAELVSKTDRLQGVVSAASNESAAATERLKLTAASSVVEIGSAAQRVGDQAVKQVADSAAPLNRKINMLIGLAVAAFVLSLVSVILR